MTHINSCNDTACGDEKYTTAADFTSSGHAVQQRNSILYIVVLANYTCTGCVQYQWDNLQSSHHLKWRINVHQYKLF